MRGAAGAPRSALPWGWPGLAYGLASGAVLPAAWAWAALHPRMRKHWAERVGWTLPAVEPGALWLHAASLGEGQAAAAVAQGAIERWPELPLLRTASSDSGREQPLPVDDVRCLPLDAPWLQRRLLRRCRPRALVLVEGELWPGLLMACQGRLPVAMLALRVGEGTRRLAHRLPALWRAMVASVGSWSARDEESAAWLEPWLGQAPPVIGDLKLEAPLAPPSLHFERPVLLGGSTRPGDEAALIEAWQGLPSRPLLLIAPRHAERFDSVAELMAASGRRWARRSQLAGERVPAELELMLLDSQGELGALYQAAAAAFVGGTFDPAIGGHSAAEAARAGAPVVHGPEIHANPGSFAQAASFPAAERRALGEALAAALAAPRSSLPRGQAVARALEQLAPLVGAPVPPEARHRPLAWPLVPAYRLAATLRARKPRSPAPCPVISVGNLASGGTGKTPVVRWLMQALSRRGLRAAVLARGYRRDARGPWLRDSQDGPPRGAWLGDEAAMLARDGFLVVSCPDRLQGATRAVQLGAQLCVLDDGLQQRDLAVDLDVITVDGLRPDAGGPLPVGERREGRAALGRGAVIWSQRGPLPPLLEPWLGQALRVQSALRPVGWLHDGVQLPLGEGPRGRVAVLVGIARPGAFLRQLVALGLVPAQRHIRPDHAWYSPQEIEAWRSLAKRLPLVTTEKDLSRLPDDLPAWALRMELCIERGEEALEELLDRFSLEHGLGGGGG